VIIIDTLKPFRTFLYVLSLVFVCGAGYGLGMLHDSPSPFPRLGCVVLVVCGAVGGAFALYALGAGPKLIYDEVRGVGIVVPTERAESNARSVVRDRGDTALFIDHPVNAKLVAVRVLADGEEVRLGFFRRDAPVIAKLRSSLAEEGLQEFSEEPPL
jgi:hypothetical protein